jgi:hypothetical protein
VVSAAIFLVAACGGGGGSSGGSPQSVDSESPNIIFFLSDDQRSDQFGAAGHSTLNTPTIDALATEGTRFTNAFVTTAICAASRATILTGLVERSHRFTFGTRQSRHGTPTSVIRHCYVTRVTVLGLLANSAWK